MAITRLPGYITIQMVRFHFKQKEAVNAKVLKDVKFSVMLDMYEMCSSELQEKLRPARTQFKEYEDWLVEQVELEFQVKERFINIDLGKYIERKGEDGSTEG